MGKRIAVVDKDECKPTNCGDYLCARLCPVNRAGQDCIHKDGTAKIGEELCIGCGICINRCPFDAIRIVNLPNELTKSPIHRFGQNEFALYSLPTPIFGKVVGILGKNGIGKSTALKIIAGLLKPNFGNYTKESNYEDLIAYFKGTEAQLFFEKIKNKEIVVSYKPQQVDMIPKHFNGTVNELLKKADEKGKLKEIAEMLQISKVLDRDIKNISGGELQRVAIAAAVLKKANLYIFDEPTSFLDIKQRINVSRFIKTLADEKTAVIVVEHDLIILDYMTDLIHIMYGDNGVYGVVSSPKNTREGINQYLDGYIPSENIRFRDSKLKFEKGAILETSEKKVITSWENIKKKLGNFSLTTSIGEVYRKEIVGVLGENGIGKTTFAKILAGVNEADSGTISKKIKISYKPQYIETESDDLVMVALKDTIAKYNNSLIVPLQITKLLTKNIKNLSGGELQRVSIALALSQDADLYLIDEPSAYLDVEQRIIVSKIIKERMEERGSTALVIDHDLMFIDYLSNRLLVFEGIPAEKGNATGPMTMLNGMNMFLRELNITTRRDKDTNRPRINKEESVKDREQKSQNKLYYE